MNHCWQTLPKRAELRWFGRPGTDHTLVAPTATSGLTATPVRAHQADRAGNDRHDRRVARLMTLARFSDSARWAAPDFILVRAPDRTLLDPGPDYRWIAHHHDRIVPGPTVVGNSYLTTTLEQHTSRYGLKTRYVQYPKLSTQLKRKVIAGFAVIDLAKIETLVPDLVTDLGLRRQDRVAGAPGSSSWRIAKPANRPCSARKFPSANHMRSAVIRRSQLQLAIDPFPRLSRSSCGVRRFTNAGRVTSEERRASGGERLRS